MASRGVPLTTIRRVAPLAACKLRRITLKDLVHRMQQVYQPGEPAAFVGVARWLQQELRIRFAHQLWEYYRQPYMLMMCRSFADVHDMHLATFETLSAFEHMDSGQDVVKFAETLDREFQVHSQTLPLLRSGIMELRSCPGGLDALHLQAFLDKFLVTKIGNRVLVDNFVSWVSRAQNGDRSAASSTGVVVDCRLAPLLSETAQGVRELAADALGQCPDVPIDDSLDTEVLIVPAHLQFIFKEVLKNAIAATVERFADAEPAAPRSPLHIGLQAFPWAVAKSELPPVQVAIHPGKYDVEVPFYLGEYECGLASTSAAWRLAQHELAKVRVADQGGGMKRSVLKRIWEYGYSGTKARDDGEMGGAGSYERDLQMQMAGFGVGVPLSRLYARYFGGDLVVHSVYGFGTDVSIRMNRLGDHVELGCSVEGSEDEQEEEEES